MSEDWRALGAEAARFLRERRFNEAAERFERVVALRPDHADSWFNLGYARRLGRQYDAALDAYREAIERGMAGPEEAHLNRAVILADCLHRPDEARAELSAALAKKGDFLVAWLNLGNLWEDLGDTGEARAA